MDALTRNYIPLLEKLLSNQKNELVEKIEEIRSDTIGCGDVLDRILKIIKE